VSTFNGGIESDFPITLKAGEHGIGAAQSKRLNFTVGRGTARIIAEGDGVVVLFSGDVPTKAGKRYNNRYCYIYRLEGGKVKELTENFDTALVQEALEAPPAAALHAG